MRSKQLFAGPRANSRGRFDARCRMTLWPPDKKMIQVATVTATDAWSGFAPGTLKVTGASSERSDPEDPDIVITPNATGGFVVQLRADRVGTATDRIYTLTATASDLAGNPATARRVAQCRTIKGNDPGRDLGSKSGCPLWRG